MNRQMWHRLFNAKESESGEISADVKLPPDSDWFSGHFPGEPILPGIAQLGMAIDAVSLAKGQGMKISEITRVRFKQIIRPGDHLEVFATPRGPKEGWFSFKIMVNGDLACNGVISVRKQQERSKI